MTLYVTLYELGLAANGVYSMVYSGPAAAHDSWRRHYAAQAARIDHDVATLLLDTFDRRLVGDDEDEDEDEDDVGYLSWTVEWVMTTPRKHEWVEPTSQPLK